MPMTPFNQAVNELTSLADTLIEFESKTRSALGFTQTLRYKDVSFLLSDRMVIADLRPLAFLDLLEEIIDDRNEAVIRLYERVALLLLCRHDWVETHRSQGVDLADQNRWSTSAFNARVCRLCTAYALSERLPEVGRGFT